LTNKSAPLDERSFKACQEALNSALATVQSWSDRTDPQLKAKLALLVMRHAETGESDPALLRKRALESYFRGASGAKISVV
jgi:hypothetical protein